MPLFAVTCSAPSSLSSCARSWTSAAARWACGLSGATCCATSTVCSTPPSRAPARHGPCAHRLMAVPPPSCRPPASLSHPGSRRPRHRKPAPNRPPNPSAAAGRGVVPRAPEFPESLQPVRYLALSSVQVELDPIFHDRSLNGRLNAPDGSYGVLYTAERSGGAFAESFLRTPGRRTLDPGLQARKAHVTLEVVRPMTLIAFDGPGLAILGATAEVVHGGLPYDCPQAWSAALHAHPAGVDGIAYSARHDPHETCYALFDRASAAIRE